MILYEVITIVVGIGTKGIIIAFGDIFVEKYTRISKTRKQDRVDIPKKIVSHVHEKIRSHSSIYLRRK